MNENMILPRKISHASPASVQMSLVFAAACCGLAVVVAGALTLTPAQALASDCTQRRWAVGFAAAALLTLASGWVQLRRLRAGRRAAAARR